MNYGAVLPPSVMVIFYSYSPISNCFYCMLFMFPKEGIRRTISVTCPPVEDVDKCRQGPWLTLIGTTDKSSQKNVSTWRRGGGAAGGGTSKFCVAWSPIVGDAFRFLYGDVHIPPTTMDPGGLVGCSGPALGISLLAQGFFNVIFLCIWHICFKDSIWNVFVHFFKITFLLDWACPWHQPVGPRLFQ